eukprot:GDKI01030058.1.p1 GENE.GDKI01030058.1~~GDKI01030058.1.p1  ORF type:complete len:133 (+),score=5.66 GDKI01030058.1:134-532(+)
MTTVPTYNPHRIEANPHTHVDRCTACGAKDFSKGCPAVRTTAILAGLDERMSLDTKVTKSEKNVVFIGGLRLLRGRPVWPMLCFKWPWKCRQQQTPSEPSESSGSPSRSMSVASVTSGSCSKEPLQLKDKGV